jgi:gas vesicle protein
MKTIINNETRTGRQIVADQTFRTSDIGTSNPTSPGLGTSGEAAQSAKDQALAAGREFRDKAKEMASSSADTMKNQASDFVDAAKDAASRANDKLQQAVDGQKNAGAEYVGSLADTMRRAAREFDKDLPIAGTYIRKAASQVEVVSDSIRNGNFNDLLRNAQSFARRQPSAFLGVAVLAGFGFIRLLKSSAETSNEGQPNWHSGNISNIRSRADAGQQEYRDEFIE